MLGTISRSQVANKYQSDPQSVFAFRHLRLCFFVGHRTNLKKKKKEKKTVPLRLLGFCPFKICLRGSFMGLPFAWIAQFLFCVKMYRGYIPSNISSYKISFCKDTVGALCIQTQKCFSLSDELIKTSDHSSSGRKPGHVCSK